MSRPLSIMSTAFVQQGVPQAPAAPAAPRVEGPMTKAEVRELARDLAQAGREAARAEAQVREAQQIANEQLARERAAQPNANEVAAAQAAAARGEAEAARTAREGVPAAGTTIVRKNGQTFVYDSDGQPVAGEAITVDTGPSEARVIAENAKETIGMVGGMALGAMFIWLLFRTIQKWLDARRSPPSFPRETMDRLARIENAIEAMAVEVERISEGQRFTTRLLSEKAPVERAG